MGSHNMTEALEQGDSDEEASSTPSKFKTMPKLQTLSDFLNLDVAMDLGPVSPDANHTGSEGVMSKADSGIDPVLGHGLERSQPTWALRPQQTRSGLMSVA